MATKQSQSQPDAGPEIITVPLFESGHEGMGSSVATAQHRYHRVHGSIDTRLPGQFRMGLAIRKIFTNTYSSPPIFAAEWVDTDTITPIILYIQGQTAYKIHGASHATACALGATCTGAALDDDGSGVPYCYVGYGGAADMKRFNIAQTLGAAMTGVKSYQLLSLNSRLYRTVVPTGGIAACGVSMCPIGADRTVLANWSAAMYVGYAHTPINAMIGVRNAPVAIKPEGIFAYNESAMRWVNFLPAWTRFPHALNGVGAFSLGDLAVIPCGDGGSLLFDGYRVTPFDPRGAESFPNQSTPPIAFAAMGSLKYDIVAVTTTGTGSYASTRAVSAGTSLRAFHGAGFTDFSAAARDGDLATKETVPLSDTLWIGWSRPFTAISFGMTEVNATPGVVTVAVGTGVGVYTSVATKDFTQNPNGTTLGQSGNMVMSVDPVAVTGWIQTAVNGVTLYWARLTFSAGDSVDIANIQIVPREAGVDDTIFPLDGIDRSGNLPHILVGKAGGSGGRAVWHDMGNLPEPDQIGAIIFGNAGGTSLNRYRNLIMLGRYGVWRMDVSAADQAGTEIDPFLNDLGLFEGPAVTPVPGRICRLIRLKIMGQESVPELPFRFYYTWDYGKPWNTALRSTRFPIELEIRQPQRGHMFRWAAGWAQATPTARLTQPCVLRIEADFEVLGDPLDSIQERTPPRF